MEDKILNCSLPAIGIYHLLLNGISNPEALHTDDTDAYFTELEMNGLIVRMASGWVCACDLSNNYEELFEAFRLSYLGKKRGKSTEFSVLKRHKDWRTVAQKINNIYEVQKIDHEILIAKGEQEMIPHLQTYLRQRRWEMVENQSKTDTSSHSETYKRYLKWVYANYPQLFSQKKHLIEKIYLEYTNGTRIFVNVNGRVSDQTKKSVFKKAHDEALFNGKTVAVCLKAEWDKSIIN